MSATVIEVADLPAVTVEALLALVAAATAADGVGPLNEEGLLGLRHPDPQRRHWLAVDPAAGSATPSGYAVVDLAGDRATGQVVVDPARRRHGIGTALVTAATDALASRGLLGQGIGWWAFGDGAGARALAARRGLAPVRQLLKLARPLAGLPAARALPPTARLRPFRPGRDDAELLRVNARAFASHPEQGRMSQSDLEARFAEAWFDPAGLLLAVAADDPDRVLGFHWTKIDPATPDDGEVYVLGVDPDAHGGGLGSALLAAGLAHLADRGVHAVELYVEGDNAPALTLYHRAGFAEIARDVMYA